MRPIVAVALAVAIAATTTGCRGEADQDADTRMAETLMAGYEPLAACVVGALAGREDFDGNLGVLIVDKGLDDQLQAISRKYLGTSVDTSADDPPTRAATAARTMRALSRYTTEAAQGADRVRRAMALVEAMSLTAFATDVGCVPSEPLQQAMRQAERAYPPAGGEPATP